MNLEKRSTCYEIIRTNGAAGNLLGEAPTKIEFLRQFGTMQQSAMMKNHMEWNYGIGLPQTLVIQTECNAIDSLLVIEN